jgi:hypothetical protein
MPRRAPLIPLPFVLAACSYSPSEPPVPVSPQAPTPSPALASVIPATPPPTHAPTPAPTLPAEALETMWTVERDGVRLTVSLERNPMPAGETTWLTSTVTNVGNDEITWFHDGCAIPVWAWGPMDGVSWPVAPKFDRDDGREPQDRSADRGNETAAVTIQFMDEALFDRKGTFGCGDIGMSDALPAGGSITRRAGWNGVGYSLLGPPPTGLVHVTATFESYWRGPEPSPGDFGTLELPFDVWVDSPGQLAIDAAEAVHAALMDPRLVEIIESPTRAESTGQIVRYDPMTATWQVGLLEYTEPSRIHMVLVDANTGELVDWVERIWNYDTDGFP